MPGLIRRERAAVLAVAIDRPVERQVARDAAVARECATTFASLRGDEDAVHHRRRGSRSAFCGFALSVGSDATTRPGDVARQPAQHLPPEARERLVVDRRRRIHLPDPRVLHRKRDRQSATVALIDEDRLLVAAQRRARHLRRVRLRHRSRDQHDRARLHLANAIHRRHASAASSTARPTSARCRRPAPRRDSRPSRRERDLEVGEERERIRNRLAA